MGWAVVDGAVRSLIARGVQPNQIVLLMQVSWQGAFVEWFTRIRRQNGVIRLLRG